MTSYWVCNKTSLCRKLCIPDKKVTMERYQAVMVALSESVMKNRLKRPYLGNHASQIKVVIDNYREVLVAY